MAEADYNGNHFFSSAELGYNIRHNDISTGLSYDIQLIVGIDYGHLSTTHYTETGANSLNLSNTGVTQTTTDIRVDANLKTQIDAVGTACLHRSMLHGHRVLVTSVRKVI